MLQSTHRLVLYSFILCACASSSPKGDWQQMAIRSDAQKASGDGLVCVNNGKLGACIMAADSSESSIALYDITLKAQKGRRRPIQNFPYSQPIATLRLIDNNQLPIQPLPTTTVEWQNAEQSLSVSATQQQATGTAAHRNQQEISLSTATQQQTMGTAAHRNQQRTPLSATTQQQATKTIARRNQQGTPTSAATQQQATGMITRNYQRGSVIYQQECFASWRDKTVVFHLESSRPRVLNFEIALSSSLPHRLKTTRNQFTLMGHLAANNGKAAIHFCANVLVRATDGDVVVTDSTLQLVNVSEATLYFISETSYGESPKSIKTSTAPYLANLSDDAWHLFNYDYNALKQRFLQSR